MSRFRQGSGWGSLNCDQQGAAGAPPAGRPCPLSQGHCPGRWGTGLGSCLEMMLPGAQIQGAKGSTAHFTPCTLFSASENNFIKFYHGVQLTSDWELTDIWLDQLVPRIPPPSHYHHPPSSHWHPSPLLGSDKWPDEPETAGDHPWLGRVCSSHTSAP